jgi:hypothetical protein
MKKVKEGDSKKVIGFECGLTDATYRIRDVDFSDKSGKIKAQYQDVLTKPQKKTAK